MVHNEQKYFILLFYPIIFARVLLKGLELLSVDGGRFEINHQLIADDTALVANSEDSRVNRFGKVCEIRKLRVSVGKSKVMRCSRYRNGG